MNLYELSTEIRMIEAALDHWAQEHDGDITDFPGQDAMDALGVEASKKALDLAVWVKNLDSEADAIGAELDRLRDRKKALETKAEWVKGWIKMVVPAGEKREDGRAAISWRPSEGVVLTCEPEDLPDGKNYFERVTTFKAVLKEIKAGILAGDKALDGKAKIDKRQNLTIK